MPNKNPHAVALGRRGGQQRSPAKTATAQANGKRGGRPPQLPRAERLRRIRERIDAGQPITAPQAALHYTTLLRSDAKALAWARERLTVATTDDKREWWTAVIATLERGVQ
jgi:hypothetical protein